MFDAFQCDNIISKVEVYNHFIVQTRDSSLVQHVFVTKRKTKLEL